MYHPTQMEVEEKADQIFTKGWKTPFQKLVQHADEEIAKRLDIARRAVLRERRD